MKINISTRLWMLISILVSVFLSGFGLGLVTGTTVASIILGQ